MFRKTRSATDNLSPYQYTRLRELGAAPKSWSSRYERLFAAVYPEKYAELKSASLSENDWRLAYDFSKITVRLEEPLKGTIIAILEGNIAACRVLLQAENYPHASALLGFDVADVWLQTNPLSPFHLNFSTEIRDLVWETVVAVSNGDINVILTFAVLSHQPLELISSLLLSHSNYPLIQNIKDDCLLHAAELNQTQTVKLLLEHGAYPNMLREQTESKRSALNHACANGNDEMVALLLKYAANVTDHHDPMDLQPLHIACEDGRENIVTLLLKYGANVHGLRHDGDEIPYAEVEPPLILACRNGHLEVVKILFENGVNDKESADEYMGAYKENINFHHPLYEACTNGHYALAKFLLENGADIEAPWKRPKSFLDDNLSTPMQFACEEKNVALTNFLLSNGADINSVDNSYNTPVHIACRGNLDTNFISFLLENSDANWLWGNEQGHTPLQFLDETGLPKEDQIYILEKFVNNIDLYSASPADYPDEFIYVYPLLVTLCDNHPDLLLQFAIISRQGDASDNFREINRILAAGANAHNCGYTNTHQALAETCFPEVSERLKLQALSVAPPERNVLYLMNAATLFNAPQEANDLPDVANEENKKKRGRE